MVKRAMDKSGEVPPILCLPSEVMTKILTALYWSDVITCRRVCRQWNVLLTTNAALAELCQKRFGCHLCFPGASSGDGEKEMWWVEHFESMCRDSRLLRRGSEEIIAAYTREYGYHVMGFQVHERTLFHCNSLGAHDVTLDALIGVLRLTLMGTDNEDIILPRGWQMEEVGGDGLLYVDRSGRKRTLDGIISDIATIYEARCLVYEFVDRPDDASDLQELEMICAVLSLWEYPPETIFLLTKDFVLDVACSIQEGVLENFDKDTNRSLPQQILTLFMCTRQMALRVDKNEPEQQQFVANLRELDQQWQTAGRTNEDMIRQLQSVGTYLTMYISWFHSSAFMGNPWTFERYLQHMMGIGSTYCG